METFPLELDPSQFNRTAGVAVNFPGIDEDDPIGEQKKAVLEDRNMKLVFDINEMEFSMKKNNTIINEMIKVARILKLNEMELYFLEDDDSGPFSPRNELESLNFIHSTISQQITENIDKLNMLKALQDAVLDKMVSFASRNEDSQVGQICTGAAEIKLMDWANKQGVKSKLNISEFKDSGRGATAAVELKVNDVALEIPISVIISEDTALNSDIGNFLKKVDGIAPETIALLWSMKECQNAQSDFNAYFASLPESFNTGLSFGISALSSLDGTLLLEEILQAKEHIRSQYDNLSYTLFRMNNEMFPPSLFTWDRFLWACELWYSNSMKIVFPDGKLKTCLVPVAGLLNHSVMPHVMHYGRIDRNSNSLKLYVSRPCRIGEQCYLSYGSASNSHLITFYGFLLRGNPYDIIPIELGLPEHTNPGDFPQDGCSITHMVRAAWLSNSRLSKYGLPSRLLGVLRNAFLEEDETETVPANARLNIVSKENEIKVLDTVLSVLQPMLEAVNGTIEFVSEEFTWDVRLAIQYRDDQRRLLASICDSCSAARHELAAS